MTFNLAITLLLALATVASDTWWGLSPGQLVGAAMFAAVALTKELCDTLCALQGQAETDQEEDRWL